jgi:glutamyl-tRNA synthetase
MLVGGKFGPGVFEIAEVLGKTETLKRIEMALKVFSD